MNPGSLAHDVRLVSVVIVAFNGEPWIRGCLESLRSHKDTCGVIVVDNGSTDRTCSVITTEFPEVDLLHAGGNLGFGRGNNVGIRAALASGARYVFLLNQDAYVLPSTVTELLAFMEKEPAIGVVSPLHCSPDPEHVDLKTLRGYLQVHAREYLADACMARPASHYTLHGVNAAAWFVRSDVFKQAGGFDPLFFMYGEDDDLLARWAHHGVVFALLPSSRVVHLRQSVVGPRATLCQDIRRRAGRCRSDLLTAVKRPGSSLAHMVAVAVAEGFLQPFAAFLVRRDARDWAASTYAALGLLREFPRIVRHARLTARVGPHFL